MSKQYGVDVGKERVDDWDKLLLAGVVARVARGHPTTILEIGCGSGAQAIRLAVAGAQVTAIDIADYGTEVYQRADQAKVTRKIHWQQGDIQDYLAQLSSSTKFSFVSMQRVLHYLSYKDAKHMLEKLRAITDCALYVSVTGTTTAIAGYYEVKNAPLTERWGKLTYHGQQLFSITEPLCLYSEGEILELLQVTGWYVKRHRVSAFGNIKIVAVPHHLCGDIES